MSDDQIEFQQMAGFSYAQSKYKYKPQRISFVNLSVFLKNSENKCVLDHVTGSFPPGCCAAVMGPSGGGKTTFMS